MKQKVPILFLCLLVLPALAGATPPGSRPSATVITSDTLEMLSGPQYNRFFFAGTVKVTGNNLVATCDQMEVESLRTAEAAEGEIGGIGAISRIIARGRVVIMQAGREARADSAHIEPQQGTIELLGNVTVTDGSGTVTGHHLILNKGERVATRVVGREGERPKVSLPSLPDLGFDDKEGKKP